MFRIPFIPIYLVNALVNDKVDMVMGGITGTAERVGLVDYAFPLMQGDIIIFTKKIKASSSGSFAVFKPLSLGVWAAVLVTLFIGLKLKMLNKRY